MKNLKYLVLVLCAALISSCSNAPKIKSGSVVKVEYKGTLKDGSTFDTTEGKRPLAFLVGANQVIPAFEKQIVSMKSGQKKKFTISAKDAYGEPDPKKVVELPRDQRFGGVELKEGSVIFANNKAPDGRVVQTPMKVVSLSDDKVKLDYNHPLAGKNLTFEVTVVEVAEPATAETASEPEAKADAESANTAG